MTAEGPPLTTFEEGRGGEGLAPARLLPFHETEGLPPTTFEEGRGG